MGKEAKAGPIWTHDEAVDFGRASAEWALDAFHDYGSLENSIGSARENVRDTLQEYHAVQFEAEAFEAFDAVIRKNA